MKFLKFITIGAIVLATSSYVQAKQACESTFAETTPLSNFTVSTDGSEVTDKKTGLTWKRCSIGQKWENNTCNGDATQYTTWQEALVAAKGVGDGYRLPNVKEYMSIMERKCSNPSVNNEVFPNFPPSIFDGRLLFYWTSTPDINHGDSMFVMNFAQGVIQFTQPNAYKKSGIMFGQFKGYALAVKNK